MEGTGREPYRAGEGPWGEEHPLDRVVRNVFSERLAFGQGPQSQAVRRPKHRESPRPAERGASVKAGGKFAGFVGDRELGDKAASLPQSYGSMLSVAGCHQRASPLGRKSHLGARC